MALRKKTTDRKGFTLIELLVVIAIIAILAAILFPVFAKARDKAMSTACLSNVKNIALALQMYLNDWDGFFPFCTSNYDTWNPPPLDDPKFSTGILPYVEGNKQMFKCATDIWIRPFNLTPMTYALGGGLVGFTGGTVGTRIIPPKNIGELKHPGELLVLMELDDSQIKNGACSTTHYGCCTLEAPYLWATNWGTFWPTNAKFMRHGISGNIGFCDGHAKEMSNQMTCTCQWHSSWRYCHEVAFIARTQDIFNDYRYDADCIEDDDGNQINP